MEQTRQETAKDSSNLETFADSKSIAHINKSFECFRTVGRDRSNRFKRCAEFLKTFVLIKSSGTYSD